VLQKSHEHLKGTVTPHECELASLASIRTFVIKWKASNQSIDVLCLNAGAQFVGLKEPKRTEEGFELTVGVNHLGHFLLANLLLPIVEVSSQRPRIVVTSSEARAHFSSSALLSVFFSAFFSA
jgi:protochlorophyllide reductase